MARITDVDPRQLLEQLLAQLPDFQLERELGQGGMGVVLLGWQRKLQREVAVKLLFMADGDAAHVSRFQREAKMYATLAHPNLVKIYDAGVDAAYPYLILEYIRGLDLKAALKANPRPTLAAIAGPLASALAYVHERGIIHRDIKSANVMLRESGAPVLMDFGLAKSLDPNATALTEDGMRVGTPYYMPPEVLTGKAQAGQPQDVYALGLVLYEVAIGKSMSELDKLGHGPVQRVRDGLPVIEEMGGDAGDLAAIVEGCLAPDPAERPTAAELVAQLAQLGIGASGLGMTYGGAAGVSTLVEGQQGSGRVRRPPSGRTAVPGQTPAAVRRPSGAVPRTDPPGTSAKGAGREVVVRAVGVFALLMVVSAAGALVWRARQREGVVIAVQPSASAPSVASPAALPARRLGKDGQELVLVPAGFFSQGAARPIFPDEAPQHRVYLDAYYIAKTELTNALYDRFCAETHHPGRVRFTASDPAFDLPDHPAVGTSWDDAQDYAHWAGQRLPTEAEWEKAARGSDGRIFPWGNDAPGKGQQCNYSDSSATTDIFGDDLGKAAKFQGTDGFVYTAPVGAFPRGASPYGCLDMAGNVNEWVADWYDPGYYAASASRNPTGPAAGKKKVLRGGCFDSLERSVRAVKRESELPTARLNKTGFRTACDP